MKTIIILFLLAPFAIFAQKGITFEVEDLKRADTLLEEIKINEIYKKLIEYDNGLSDYDIEKKNITVPYNIIAKSKSHEKMVNYGYQSFFNGMFKAYMEHRPFVISPDMIMLLISQGFAQHVNNNAEKLRSYFVNFKDKKKLIVQNDYVHLDDPNSPWEEMFPEFTKQISSYTGTELINALTCDFSTSNSVSKVASQITIMNAMKEYFNYDGINAGCGIPEITLEGTTEDWQRVLDKTKYLRKYELEWWIDEIEPILNEFVTASKGEIYKRFWQNMFKYHQGKAYKRPNKIDGWIVKFFPYNKEGKRNNLEEFEGDPKLPDEIVKVDMKFTDLSRNPQIEAKLELWAGFIGLEQNKNTFALKPQIGWMIRKKDSINIRYYYLLKEQNGHTKFTFNGDSIPKELMCLEKINYLELIFSNEIKISDGMEKIKIENLSLIGKISDIELKRLCKMFPKTELIINNKKYVKGEPVKE